jgi:hypothetical protein
MPNYKKVILASGPEILSVRNPIRNAERKYIAGLDPIEAWDRRMMEELHIPVQSMTPPATATAAARVLSFPERAARPNLYTGATQAGLVAVQP